MGGEKWVVDKPGVGGRERGGGVGVEREEGWRRKREKDKS